MLKLKDIKILKRLKCGRVFASGTMYSGTPWWLKIAAWIAPVSPSQSGRWRGATNTPLNLTFISSHNLSFPLSLENIA
jgi:hypothetical protein